MENLQENKLKIGILSFYYPHLGGSGIVTTRIAKKLAKEGHEIHFIGYDTDINPEDMQNFGIKLHKVSRVDYPALKNEPYIWSLASKIYDVHKEHKLDLIHANYALPHAASAYLARERLKQDGEHLPYLVTGHGSDIHTNGAKNEINPILQLCLNQADAITYVSEDLKKIAEKELKISDNGEIIKNFVDTNIFKKKGSKIREKLGIPEKAFVIGHVSNFAPIKQTEHFWKLAEYMKGANILDNVYFLMVGDGRERSILEDEIRRIGIENKFKFRGRLNEEEVIDSYNAMDVLVLPSKHEGNPLAILEAMACQIPVIGSKVGGIEETIVPGTGYLFDSWNIESLADYIFQLKNDPGKVQRVGKNGLKHVQDNYSVEKIINKYHKIYNKIKNTKK